jgi:septal ring factor EnvC (AmiA/AmiB activator)
LARSNSRIARLSSSVAEALKHVGERIAQCAEKQQQLAGEIQKVQQELSALEDKRLALERSAHGVRNSLRATQRQMQQLVGEVRPGAGAGAALPARLALPPARPAAPRRLPALIAAPAQPSTFALLRRARHPASSGRLALCRRPRWRRATTTTTCSSRWPSWTPPSCRRRCRWTPSSGST